MSGLDQAERDLEGELFNSLVISSTVTGGNDNNEGVCQEEITGCRAVAVDERMLATLPLKNMAKPLAVSFVDRSCFGGCSRLSTVFHKQSVMFLCSLTVVVQNELTLFW